MSCSLLGKISIMTHSFRERLDELLQDNTRRGLFIFLPNGFELQATREFIENFATQFINNPQKLPPPLKQLADYHPCPICPCRDIEGSFCHALWPVLPFLEIIDKYRSYDSVTMIYRDNRSEAALVAITTLQRALVHVATLSLMHYCETGRTYWRYFNGITPLMSPSALASRLYLNMYFECKGDNDILEKNILSLASDLKTIGQCLLKRLRLFCKNDALLNAFASACDMGEILKLCKHELVDQELAKFEAENPPV